MKKSYCFSLSILLLVAGGMFTACSPRRPSFHIGVSQCSDDEWRQKMNREMVREAAFIGDMELTFRSAGDRSDHQSADIDSFINEGVDLLIVAPNEAQGVTAAVKRAREKGIPVVLVDRKLNSDDYDAYVGTDNYDIGYKAGTYAAASLKDGGSVVEIGGLTGSSPATERHKGFVDALKGSPNITLLASADGEWRSETAEKVMDSVLQKVAAPDLVFAHNDRMAVGARRATARHGVNPLFIGVDALPGKGHGVELVTNGTLEASLIYSTGGDRIIQVADSILKKLEVQRNSLLSTALVDSTNARILSMQVAQIEDEEAKIEELNERIDTFLLRYSHQKVMLISSIVILILIAIVFALIVRAYWTNVKTSRTLAEQKKKLEAQRNQLILLSKQIKETDDGFTDKVRKVIEAHMTETEFGVEELAAEMGMGRSQLFRKVKSLCDCSPNELIRAARLKRAAELLTHTDKTVAEVSFATGFSSPSYFAKCYKEYFGSNPKGFLKK